MNFMEPYFISRIEDKNGVVIELFTNSPKEILSEDKNVVMVASSGRYKQGSGSRLRWKYRMNNEIAGKTALPKTIQTVGLLVLSLTLLLAFDGADNRAVDFET